MDHNDKYEFWRKTHKKPLENIYQSSKSTLNFEIKERLGKLRENVELLMASGSLNESDINRFKAQNERLILENRLRLQEIEALKQKYNQLVQHSEARKVNILRLYERLKEEFLEQVKPALYHNINTYHKSIKESQARLEDLLRRRKQKNDQYKEELMVIKIRYAEEIKGLEESVNEFIQKEASSIEEALAIEQEELIRAIKEITAHNEELMKANNNLEKEIKEIENGQSDEVVHIKKRINERFEKEFEAKRNSIKQAYSSEISKQDAELRRLQADITNLQSQKKEIEDTTYEAHFHNLQQAIQGQSENATKLFEKELQNKIERLQEEEKDLKEYIAEINTKLIEKNEQKMIEAYRIELETGQEFNEQLTKVILENERLNEQFMLLEYENDSLEEFHRNQINEYYAAKKAELDAFTDKLRIDNEIDDAKSTIAKSNHLVKSIGKDKTAELMDEINHLNNTLEWKQVEIKDKEELLRNKMNEKDNLMGRADQEARRNTDPEIRELKLMILEQIKRIISVKLESITA